MHIALLFSRHRPLKPRESLVEFARIIETVANLVQTRAEAFVIDAAMHIALLFSRHRPLKPRESFIEFAYLVKCVADDLAMFNRNECFVIPWFRGQHVGEQGRYLFTICWLLIYCFSERNKTVPLADTNLGQLSVFFGWKFKTPQIAGKELVHSEVVGVFNEVKVKTYIQIPFEIRITVVKEFFQMAINLSTDNAIPVEEWSRMKQ